MRTDRIQRLEMDMARVSRQIAGMPVRLARGAGTAANTIRKARVVSSISAATAAGTWGSGTVQLKDETTGVPGGDAVDCDNEWPEAFPADAMVSVNTGYSPYRVEGGTCTALSAETFWGDS